MNLTEPGISRSNIRRTVNQRGVSWSVLVINGGVLIEGASYKFRLNARDRNGQGYAEIRVIVNWPPTLGTLTSNRLEGMF